MKIRDIIIGLVLLVALLACQNDDDPVIEERIDPINTWIFSTLDFWYLWREEMPGDVNQALSPEDYFEDLLFNGDRFSILVDDFQGLINSLDGQNIEAGYELSLFRETGTANVLGAITYVKSPSPAEAAGLIRGDIIRAINGRQMTTANFEDVLSDIFQNHSIEYLSYNANVEQYETRFLSLTVENVTENPHFLDTVYTTQNGNKVGYYVYNFFRRGVDGGEEYSEQMDAIFENFKAQGIEELILDLRYNGGGSISAATDLASLIGKGVSADKNFYSNQHNPTAEEAILNDPDLGIDFIQGSFLDKAANIGEQLSSGRVYVLTGRGTASASELIINGLTPFMDVTIIGDTTVGKNVGSYAFEDTQNNSNYGMLPIAFEVTNSLGQSDYENGFVPASQYLVNELQLPLRALGDIDEPLLATAMADIEGQLGGRRSRATNSGYRTLVTSKQLRPFINELIIDTIKP